MQEMSEWFLRLLSFDGHFLVFHCLVGQGKGHQGGDREGGRRREGTRWSCGS